VRLFAAAGAKVAFNYQSAKDQADALANECGAANCRAVQCELSTAEAAGKLVAATVAEFGRLDILVANHGIWPPVDAPIDRMTDEQWRRTMAVNLDSVFGLVKHAVGQMKKQRSHPTSQAKAGSGADAAGKSAADANAAGHIVLVSSTAGQRGEAFHCDYAASKGALISMVKGLSTELARDGIRVNCVAPGWVYTDMAMPALEDPATRAKVFGTIPLGRVGTVDEIAGPILFLCTPYAGFITGEIFNVNGGAVLVG
jgi:3-oxoacyl-[acyl-carrier protein] reductase